GRRMGSSIEIVDGIREGERVAAAAAFFLDSESQLRGSLQGYESSEPQPATSATASQLAITFTSIPNPPRVGENQFEVAVKDASGTPVSDGGVSIQFFMAAMPTMNMPAMRNVVNLRPAGGGLYRGTGQVLTGGRWETTITVNRNGQRIGSRQLPVVTE